MVLPAALMDARLLFLAGGAGASLGSLAAALPGAMGRFCAAHSCQGDGGRCGGEVVGAEGDYLEAAGRRGRDRDRDRERERERGRGGRRGLVDEAVRFCTRHECSRSGCRAEATHRSRRGGSGRGGGLCDRHYRKRKDGAGAGGGVGGGFGPMGGMPVPMPMPMGMGMGMGMGFPSPFFGPPPGYDSSESSSDSDDGWRPRGLPFGGPFY